MPYGEATKISGVKPRRLLYVAKTARGGSAFSLYYLVKELDRRRYEPVILFFARERTYITERLAEVGAQVCTLGLTDSSLVPTSAATVGRRDIGKWLETHVGKWASQAYAFLKGCYAFARRDVSKIAPIVRAIQASQADVVHINNGLRFGKPALIAAWLMQKPCVCHVRMFDDLSPFDRLFARFVNTFVYISRAVEGHYTAQAIPLSKGTVIHNALDLSDYSVQPDGDGVRAEFGWPAQTPLVGIVGRLDWWKGHEYFLQALAEAAQQIPDLKGLVVGEPEHTPRNHEYYLRLLRLTETLGLKGRIVFTGFRPDIPRLMSALDVVVLSSAMPEPFGRVLIEGMAAGKPVVATATGGVLDVIEHDLTGLLVPPQDSSAIARAVLSLLLDRNKAKRIGRAARQRVEEKFTLTHHIVAVQSVYDTVLKHCPRSRRAGQQPVTDPHAKVR